MTAFTDKLNADDLLSLKAGDIVYEFGYGRCYIGLLTEDPWEDDNGFVGAKCLWYTKDSRGKGSLGMSRSYGYFSNFYTYPAYIGSWPFKTLEDIESFNPRTHIDDIDRKLNNE